MAEKSRKGDNLYTCAIVATTPDTGKLVWYFPTFGRMIRTIGTPVRRR